MTKREADEAVARVRALLAEFAHPFTPLSYASHNCGYVKPDGFTCGRHEAKHELADEFRRALDAGPVTATEGNGDE